MTHDFIYLDVERLAEHYANPSPQWREKVLALAETEIKFFLQNNLIRADAPALSGPTEKAVLRFGDFSPEGKAFIMSQAVERWLSSCDKKGTIAAYKDSSGLLSRLQKFRRSSKGIHTTTNR